MAFSDHIEAVARVSVASAVATLNGQSWAGGWVTSRPGQQVERQFGRQRSGYMCLSP